MATSRPKVQGYVLPQLYDRFTRWKQEQGIEKESEALNALFAQFFSLDPEAVPPSIADRLEVLEGKLIA